MRYLGFLLISAAAAMLVSERCASILRAAREYKSVLSLLLYLKSSVMTERRTPAEAVIAFSEREEGRDIPWLSELRSEMCVNAFLRERRILSAESSLDGREREALAGLFFELGKHTAEQEIQRISSIVSLFEKKSTERADSAEKSVKGAWILYVTAVIGGFILVI